ncbi:lipid asymmetry maintenance protein MlaB [Buttiauxella warmboldiae]|uniref:Lipid asymmetry maintenance protein MlaB n=1 Tax=Buttiauxella warmboldiae TaxID=82993 RepID=A0A3N5DUC2_9ENTR|nr:lipid asymmetry maintenance protein MlaB [Buttiauxella warmboldiae]RPH20836.1 lipid asymmetry maintenance protein MlaB [Buttiauxella warmboldiae]
MADELNWQREAVTLHLTGELDSDTVGPLWQQREQIMAGTKVLNLSGLTRVDTSGLALLIHLVAFARRQNVEIQLQGASENLQTLTKLYNLPEEILPAFAG